MKELIIPFQHYWEVPMLTGRKTMTSRTKFYTQEEGDYFKVFGEVFVITKLYCMTLENVAKECWQQEGCINPAHFRRVWVFLHPKKGWQPKQSVCCHEFKKL